MKLIPILQIRKLRGCVTCPRSHRKEWRQDLNLGRLGEEP